MSTFHSQSFQQRMKVGGDLAENAFRDYAERKGFQAEHYGFDRSTLKRFGKLPQFVRLTPDFACTSKEKGFVVECKGVGRWPDVKIKLGDIEGMRKWWSFTDGELYIFINDSHHDRVSFFPFSHLEQVLKENQFKVYTFHDGRDYHKIPKTRFDWEDKDEQTD